MASNRFPEPKGAFQNLKQLLVKRLAPLNVTAWEHLVADYFKTQGVPWTNGKSVAQILIMASLYRDTWKT